MFGRKKQEQEVNPYQQISNAPDYLGQAIGMNPQAQQPQQQQQQQAFQQQQPMQQLQQPQQQVEQDVIESGKIDYEENCYVYTVKSRKCLALGYCNLVQ